MSKIEELRAKLIEFFRTIQEDLEVQATPGKVLSVDEGARTCEVEPASAPGAPVTAGLQPIQSSEVGLVQIPEEGSRVIIDWITEDHAVVVLCSKVTRVLLDCEEITINGGENAGIPISGNVAQRLNNVETDLNNLKSILAGWVPPTSSPDSGAALKSALTGAGYLTNTLAQTKEGDLANSKVKH